MSTTSTKQKKYIYSGVKKVDKWIEKNLFTIQEASRGGKQQYLDLIHSLGLVLSTCRNSIKIKRTTKLNTVIDIDYTGGSWKKFSLAVYKVPPKLNAYKTGVRIPKNIDELL